jgi:hypothetical protein
MTIEKVQNVLDVALRVALILALLALAKWLMSGAEIHIVSGSNTYY